MVDEIEGIGRKRKSDEPMAWKPWQPPVVPQAPAAKPAAPAPQGPVARIGGDRNGTGPLKLDAAINQLGKTKAVDVDGVALPGEPVGEVSKPGMVQRLGDAAQALGELGVVASLGQVAAAYVQTPVSFSHMAESLEAFAGNLAKVSEQLHQVPGVGEALAAFGGVGAIVSGVMGFKEELESVQQDGPNLGNGLGAAASAGQLVGGVATALSALCPPLAPVGASILAASAAFKLGKLGWENRDKLAAAAQNALKVVGDKGAAIVGDRGAAIVANNSAAIVANNSAAMTGGRPFAWMTG